MKSLLNKVYPYCLIYIISYSIACTMLAQIRSYPIMQIEESLLTRICHTFAFVITDVILCMLLWDIIKITVNRQKNENNERINEN